MTAPSMIEERSLWEAVFQRAPHGMAQLDLEGGWMAVNAALCALLGRSRDELLATELEALTHPEDLAVGEPELRGALAGELDSYEVQRRYLRGDGGVVWAQVTVTVVRGSDGEPRSLLAHLLDVTEHKQAEAQLAEYAEQLEELARQDPLTGLRNHRTFETWLDAQLHVARRTRSQCSIVLFDVDDLRESVGRDGARSEQLLARVAAVVKGACRSTDVAARVGNDEFALILPGADASVARAVAGRITAEVAGDGSVSMAFGVGCWPADGEGAEGLLRRAGAQLRATKGRGPDRGRSEGGAAGGAGGGGPAELGQIVAAARRALDADVAYLTRVDGSQEVVWALDGAPFAEGEDARVCAEVRLSDGRRFGRLCVAGGASRPEPAAHDLEVLRSLAAVVASTIESDRHALTARRDHEEMVVMTALLSALSARDHYTGEHSKTVVRLAVAVGRRLGLDDDEVQQVRQVALLHDIGKVGIPDSILQKDGPLSIQEWKLMREHPAIGARILAGTRTLAHLAPAVHAEHERFDGTGYPNGLSGAAIPIASRITLACDAYDAMTTDRPYRESLPVQRAAEQLALGAGTEFDPAVVAALVAELGVERVPAAGGVDATRTAA